MIIFSLVIFLSAELCWKQNKDRLPATERNLPHRAVAAGITDRRRVSTQKLGAFDPLGTVVYLPEQGRVTAGQKGLYLYDALFLCLPEIVGLRDTAPTVDADRKRHDIR